MSAIEELLKRNRRELDGAEARAVRRLLTSYDQMTERLESEIQRVARMVPTLSTERRAVWLESMLLDVRSEYAAWERRALGELDAVAVEGDRQGRTHATRQARAFGLMPVGVDVGRLNIRAAERLVGMLSPDSPLRQVISRYGPLGEQIIETELAAAIVSGEGERQITRRIVRELRAPWLRSRLSGTVRTELMRSYRGSQIDQYRDMGTAVAGWRWTCARSFTTCLACIARDGTEYPLTTEFSQAHINCFPAGTVVNGPEALAATRRWWVGDLVEITTAGGHHLAVTPNHPILTARGWVAAGALVEGDYVVSHRRPQGVAAAINPDNERHPAFIEQVAEALTFDIGSVAARVPSTTKDFHGDGVNGEVDVVRSGRFLRGALDTPLPQPCLHQQFVRGDMRLALFAGERAPAAALPGISGAASSPVRRADDVAVLGGRAAGRERSVHLDAAANGDALLSQEPEYRSAADTTLAAELLGGRAGEVALDQIIRVSRRPFAGHVYNLQTKEGWYTANGILTHNCRCSASPIPADDYTEAIRMADEYGTAGNWFAQLPAHRQRQMMPSADAYAAYRRGDLSLDDFVGTVHSPLWGTSIYQRSGIGALRFAGHG